MVSAGTEARARGSGQQEVLSIQAVQKDWGPIVHYRPAVMGDLHLAKFASGACAVHQNRRGETPTKVLATASGRSIKVFSTASGKLLQEHFHHDCKVVGVQRVSSKKNKDEFVSCDEGGTVCFWSTETKEEPRTFSLGTSSSSASAVVSFSLFGEEKQQLLALVRKKEGLNTGHLLCFTPPYTTSQPVLLARDVMLGVNKVAVMFGGRHIAFISHHGLIVLAAKPNTKERTRLKHMVGDRALTCLAAHPTQEVLASGDVTGRILLWYEVTQSRAVRKELHWHEMPVADLAFSALGNELYSGGAENVLVKWQLTSQRQYFLPRLGLPIRFITTDPTNTLLITAHIDNALSVISARDFRRRGMIQGLSMNTEIPNSFPAGLNYDSRTRSLILNGRTGHVQFYDPHHSRQLHHLDITLSNYYSQERQQRIQNTEVEHVAVTKDGLRMATTEFRQDLEASMEIRLKFWHFNEKEQSWYLNTSVDLPHQKRVNAIAFQPLQPPGQLAPLCVSCGEDGKFKIWEEEDATDIYGAKSVWMSTGVGFYRHLPATIVSISPDGSLLAAGFDSILTIWLPQSCQLMGTLSQPYLTERLLQVEFGQSEGCWSVVVTRTHHWVCAWDLFTCTLSWRVSITSSCMAVDPLSSYMAVFSEFGSVYVFEPHSSELVASQQCISKSRPTTAVFVPRLRDADACAAWNEKSSLMYITEDQTLQAVEVKMDLDSANDQIAGRVRQLVHHSEAGGAAPTPFAALIAKTRSSSADAVPREEVGPVGTASHGVQVEKAHALVDQVLSEVRVYRMDSFAALATEFCKMVIPEAVTSEEKLKEVEMEHEMKERAKAEKKKAKRQVKAQRKELSRVMDSDFTDLMRQLTL